MRTNRETLLFAAALIVSFLATVALSSWRAGLWPAGRAPASGTPLPALTPPLQPPAHYAQLDERHRDTNPSAPVSPPLAPVARASRALASRPGASAPESDPQDDAASAINDSTPPTPSTTDEFLAEQESAAARSSRAR